MDVKFETEKCIVFFFDIYGFERLIRDKSIDEIFNIIYNVWDYINNDIKNNRHMIIVETFLFSDCGFILFPVKDGEDKLIIFNFCNQSATNLMNIFLDNEIFIRGAVSFGRVSYTNSLLIGDAIIQAVRLEKKCPGHFVILPYNNVIGFIDQASLIKPIRAPIPITLNNLNESMLCNVILPINKTKYLNELTKYANHYMTYGPYNQAKLWNDSLLLAKNIIEGGKN